ncbi:MAG: response regulator [Coriobacteriales bacterium]|jgi:signal transduction histidine kinase/CheY-like chemotaxis protein|nr:response regulator [Coriobacteriales bacterium]
MLIVFIAFGFTVTNNVSSTVDKNTAYRLDTALEFAAKQSTTSGNVQDVLRSTYHQQNLSIARAVAQLIVEDRTQLQTDNMRRLVGTLRIEEINVTDSRGVQLWGSDPAFFGFDFSTDPKYAPYMRVVNSQGETYIQPPLRRLSDGAIIQYYGVSRVDEPGIVQIGVISTDIDNMFGAVESKPDLTDVANAMGGGIFIMDPNGTVSSDSFSSMSTNAVNLSDQPWYQAFREQAIQDPSGQSGLFEIELPLNDSSLKGLAKGRIVGNLAIVAWVESSEVADYKFAPVLITAVIAVFSLLILLNLLYITLSRFVIRPLDSIHDELQAMEKGARLDTESIKGAPEVRHVAAAVNDSLDRFELTDAILVRPSSAVMENRVKSQQEQANSAAAAEALAAARAECAATADSLAAALAAHQEALAAKQAALEAKQEAESAQHAALAAQQEAVAAQHAAEAQAAAMRLELESARTEAFSVREQAEGLSTEATATREELDAARAEAAAAREQADVVHAEANAAREQAMAAQAETVAAREELMAAQAEAAAAREELEAAVAKEAAAREELEAARLEESAAREELEAAKSEAAAANAAAAQAQEVAMQAQEAAVQAQEVAAQAREAEEAANAAAAQANEAADAAHVAMAATKAEAASAVEAAEAAQASVAAELAAAELAAAAAAAASALLPGDGSPKVASNGSGDEAVERLATQVAEPSGELLTAISRVTEILLVSDEAQFEEDLANCLSILGEAANASRVLLLKQVLPVPDGHLVYTVESQWWDDLKARKRARRLSRLDFGTEPPEWMHKLIAGTPLAGDASSFPAGLRKFVESQGITSLLALPVYMGSSFWGYAEFSYFNQEHQFSDAEIDLLRAGCLSLTYGLTNNLMLRSLVAARKGEQSEGVLLGGWPVKDPVKVVAEAQAETEAAQTALHAAQAEAAAARAEAAAALAEVKDARAAASAAQTMAEAAAARAARAPVASAAAVPVGEYLNLLGNEMRPPMHELVAMAVQGRASSTLEGKDLFLDKIKGTSSHLLEVVDDIVDFSRLQERTLEPRPVEFGFEQLLRQIVGIAKPRLEAKKLHFSVYMDRRVPSMLFTDSALLVRAVSGLLDHAIAATPEGGKVGITTKLIDTSDGYCTVAFDVSDTGTGLSAERLDSLFVPLSQADGLAQRVSGSGDLALALAQGIIELLGGRIWATTETGKGTTIHLTFKARLGGQPHAAQPLVERPREASAEGGIGGAAGTVPASAAAPVAAPAAASAAAVAGAQPPAFAPHAYVPDAPTAEPSFAHGSVTEGAGAASAALPSAEGVAGAEASAVAAKSDDAASAEEAPKEEEKVLRGWAARRAERRERREEARREREEESRRSREDEAARAEQAHRDEAARLEELAKAEEAAREERERARQDREETARREEEARIAAARLEEEAQRAKAEQQAREDALRREREEEQRRAHEQAARREREEQARRAEEARQAREEAERQAREEAARQAREEAARRAEAERREEAARTARQEAARREEEARQAREEADRVEEAARMAREDAARREAETRHQIEAQRAEELRREEFARQAEAARLQSSDPAAMQPGAPHDILHYTQPGATPTPQPAAARPPVAFEPLPLVFDEAPRVATPPVSAPAPSAPAPAQTQAPAQSPAAPSSLGIDDFSGFRILFASATHENRDAITALLEPTGIQIDFASDGQEVIDLFLSAPRRYAAIFMDMRMPHVDGIKVARYIRRLNLEVARNVPLVAMSPSFSVEELSLCREAGMDDHVRKPLDLSEVLVKLRAFIDNRA